MRGFRLFEKPLGVFSPLPSLQVVGTLPGYEQGEAYEGRLDIINSVGKCTAELLSNNLPPGASVHVDNFTKEVVVTWPSYSPETEEKETIVNGDFQLASLEGWTDLRGNSWSVKPYETDNPSPYPTPPGNHAAWMEGVGRGDHTLESIRYPVTPGQPVMARSLWDQGPSNKDNNNLWTAFAFYTPGGVMLQPDPWSQWYGDRIHDRTNKNRHWSTVNTTVPQQAGFATVRLIAHRRNSRNRQIIVDDVQTSGLSYRAGVANGDDFYLTIRVRDSANRFALWSGIIPWRSFFVTSRPYAVIEKARVGVEFGVSDMALKIGSIDGAGIDAAGVGFGLVDFLLKSSAAVDPVENADTQFSLSGFQLREIIVRRSSTESASADFTITGFMLRLQLLGRAKDDADVAFSLQAFTLG